MNIIKVTIRVKDDFEYDEDLLIPRDKLIGWLTEYAENIAIYEHTTLTFECVGYLKEEFLQK
jgi:hypothetical protein